MAITGARRRLQIAQHLGAELTSHSWKRLEVLKDPKQPTCRAQCFSDLFLIRDCHNYVWNPGRFAAT
jgi:hypothetical protein